MHGKQKHTQENIKTSDIKAVQELRICNPVSPLLISTQHHLLPSIACESSLNILMNQFLDSNK